jgi:mRNA interferase MazF
LAAGPLSLGLAPISQSGRAASFRPQIESGAERRKILVDQIGIVDVSRLGDLVRHVTAQELWGIDEALVTIFGLS